MSTPKRNDAWLVPVDPQVADALRDQSLAVLEFNHDYFEDLRDFGPEAQHALSLQYREAFDVLEALGWPRPNPAETVEVPLTQGHVDQLRRRRLDLGQSNLDRLPEDANAPIPLETLAEITIDRLAGQALDRLFGAFERARRAG
jgi:hypothetical protein